jgi:excinuclease UvrABC ATPase subunit
MANDRVVVRGPREHNLESIDVEVPRDQLVVITGLTGSGTTTTCACSPPGSGSRSAPGAAA